MISKEAQKLDDMMRKVEGMLATADSLNDTNPEAAANYRANAERVMAKYKIEQEDLIARGDLRVDGLNVQFKQFGAYPWASHYATTYSTLLSYAMHHAGIRGVYEGYDDNGHRQVWLVGYESDIRYAEMLYLNARLIFSDRMEPKYDPSKSDEENVYRMRNAGMERGRIGEAMGWGGEGTQGPNKVTRVYKRACQAIGEDPVVAGRSVSVKDYRQAYADGFTSEFWSRLSLARIAVESETQVGLVLHGRDERIKEAIYARWESMRPKTDVATVSKTAARKSRTPRWTKADEARYQRSMNAASSLGRNQGRKAASEIDVSNNNTPKKRL